jgi:hypothetical protein
MGWEVRNVEAHSRVSKFPSADDAVYLEGEILRREYVLSESGKVWTGSSRRPNGKRWIFGQFDDVVLPAVMYLLELSKLKHADRGNPVQIARAISAIVSIIIMYDRILFKVLFIFSTLRQLYCATVEYTWMCSKFIVYHVC